MYCLRLGRKLKKPLHEVLSWPMSEIRVQIAYDIATSDDFKKRQENQALEQEYDRLDLETKRKLFKQAIEGITRG